MMRKIVTFVLLLICLSVTSVAQVGGGMTDKQVVEYVQNGLLQGKSQQQISTELARRGVTKEQAERVKLLYEQQKKNGKNSSSSTLDNTKGRSGQFLCNIPVKNSSAVRSPCKSFRPACNSS